MLSSELRVLTWDEAKNWRDAWRQRDLRIGFTNGCFDILHIGHLSLLEFTQKYCDRLIVGINSDASVKRLKGKHRPINTERDRATLVAALAMVDAVVLFGDDTPLKLIQMLEPDALFKGADYHMNQIVGSDFVAGRGGRVYRAPYVPDRSSSKILHMVRG